MSAAVKVEMIAAHSRIPRQLVNTFTGFTRLSHKPNAPKLVAIIVEKESYLWNNNIRAPLRIRDLAEDD